jgi:hypothetical protein
MAVFFSALLITGCNLFGSMEDAQSVINQNSTGRANVKFQLLMPDNDRPVTTIKASQSGVAQVVFLLRIINNSTGQTHMLKKIVSVDSEGKAGATFNNVPASTVLGEIKIEGANINGFRQLHGASDLMPGDNDLFVSPKGSGNEVDLVAAVISRLINESEIVAKLPLKMATAVKSAAGSILSDESLMELYDKIMDRVIVDNLSVSDYTRITISDTAATATGKYNWTKTTTEIMADIPEDSWVLSRILKQGVTDQAFLSFTNSNKSKFGVLKIDSKTGQRISYLLVESPEGSLIVLNDNSVLGGGTLNQKPVVFRWDAQENNILRDSGSVIANWNTLLPISGTTDVPDPAIETIFVSDTTLTATTKNPDTGGLPVDFILDLTNGHIISSQSVEQLRIWAKAEVNANQIGWDEIPAAGSYNLYYSIGSNNLSLSENDGRIENVKPPFKHEQLTAGQDYFYIVTWINKEEVESEPSSVVKSTPIAPSVISVSGITLNPASLTLSVDQTKTLTATIEPENADNRTIAWSSTDETVAQVNESGLVTAIKTGIATITAITEDGNYQATCSVKVTATILPVVSTNEAVEINAIKVSASGSATSAGNLQLTAKGFVYSISENPTLANNTGMITVNDTLENYVGLLSDLQPQTTYYLKAYATNINGTAYGNQVSFTTPGAIETLGAEHLMRSATLSAKANLSEKLTEKGIVTGTSENPDVDEHFIKSDMTAALSNFSSPINGLEPGTTYYYRAYLKIGDTTYYGENKAFTTLPRGTGTESDPFRIETASDLNDVRNALDKHYIQITDIDLSSSLLADESWYSDSLGWTPIGSAFSAFSGSYNGDSHRISNLFIDRGEIDYIGLFAYINNNGSVKNMKVENVNIKGKNQTGAISGAFAGLMENCSSTGTVESIEYYAGGLVGACSGTISGSQSNSTVKAAAHAGGLVGEVSDPGISGNVIIKDSHSEGEVSGSFSVGGIAGRARYWATIENCYSESNVSATNAAASVVGGLVGNNDASVIKSSYNTGIVNGEKMTGGLVGINENGGEILGCHSSGEVTGTLYVGGLVGENNATIKNSYSTGDVTGTGLTGGLAGFHDGDEIELCYSTSNVTGQDDTGGLVGFAVYNSTITKSYSTGNVTGHVSTGGLVGHLRRGESSEQQGAIVSDCYSTSTVTGTKNVGGFAGEAEGTNGPGTSRSSLGFSYSTGTVEGDESVSGFLGTGTGVVTSCYWNSETSQIGSSIDNSVPLTSEQMRSADSFGGFDFNNIWSINGGTSFPYLKNNVPNPLPN